MHTASITISLTSARYIKVGFALFLQYQQITFPTVTVCAKDIPPVTVDEVLDPAKKARNSSAQNFVETSKKALKLAE